MFQREVGPRLEEELDPVVVPWTGRFSRIFFRPELIRAADLFLSLRTSDWAFEFEEGAGCQLALCILPGTTPGEEEGSAGSVWHIPPGGSRAAASAPHPWPGQVLARGSAGLR